MGAVHTLPSLLPCLLPPCSFCLSCRCLSGFLYLCQPHTLFLSICLLLSLPASCPVLPLSLSLVFPLFLSLSTSFSHTPTPTFHPFSLWLCLPPLHLLPSLFPSLEADLCDQAKPRGKVRAPCRDRYRLSLTCHLCLWQRNSGAQERQGIAVTGKGTSSWG